MNLPIEIWDIIFRYVWELNIKDLHQQLKSECIIRQNTDVGYWRDGEAIFFKADIILHESIHPICFDNISWQSRGWCSAKCGSFNWPHVCSKCPCCNHYYNWCDCDYPILF